MLTDRFCFVHIPRCGGSAFKALLRAQHPTVTILGEAGHRTGACLRWIDIPKVALVRDPWSWYASVAGTTGLPLAISETYTATLHRYLWYPGQTSRSVQQVYCWPWEMAVKRLLTAMGYPWETWGDLTAFRHIRARGGLSERSQDVSAADIEVWRAYGGQI